MIEYCLECLHEGVYEYAKSTLSRIGRDPGAARVHLEEPTPRPTDGPVRAHAYGHTCTFVSYSGAMPSPRHPQERSQRTP